MYTTIEKVRELSGFDDTVNITDTVVRGKIITASSMFDSAIRGRYSLPLFYHRSNTLTFSGTATGNATMTIVINGVDYNLSILNLMTASQVADLFRDLTSTDFAIDRFYGEEQVKIISKSCSSADSSQVTVSNAPLTAGISVAIGTIQDSYPAIVDQVVADIACALLLIDNYGVESADTNKDGYNRMDRINETLLKLQGNSKDGFKIDLYDEVCNQELLISNSSKPSYLPSNATAETTSAKFTINQVF